MKYKVKEQVLDDYVTEMVSDEYFSTQSLKRAVWQYLIDHSKVVNDEGLLQFNFYIPSEKELWRRVKARDDGIFQRRDLSTLRERENRKHKQVKDLKKIKIQFETEKSKQKQWEARIHKFEDEGTFTEKILLKIAKITRSLSRYLTNKVVLSKNHQ